MSKGKVDISKAIHSNGYLIGMLESAIMQLSDTSHPPKRKKELIDKARKAHEEIHGVLAEILIKQYEQ